VDTVTDVAAADLARLGARACQALAVLLPLTGIGYLLLPDNQGELSGRPLVESLVNDSGRYLLLRWLLALIGVVGLLALPVLVGLVERASLRRVALTLGLLGFAVLALDNVKSAVELDRITETYPQVPARLQDVLAGTAAAVQIDPAGVLAFGATGVGIALVGAGLWPSPESRLTSLLGIATGAAIAVSEPVELIWADAEAVVQATGAIVAATAGPVFFVLVARMLASGVQGRA
jgi:hypothetical protein